MGYVLCSIDIGDAFLTVDQKELTEVVCTDASGAATTTSLEEFYLAKGMALRCGMSLLASFCRPS